MQYFNQVPSNAITIIALKVVLNYSYCSKVVTESQSLVEGWKFPLQCQAMSSTRKCTLGLFCMQFCDQFHCQWLGYLRPAFVARAMLPPYRAIVNLCEYFRAVESPQSCGREGRYNTRLLSSQDLNVRTSGLQPVGSITSKEGSESYEKCWSGSQWGSISLSHIARGSILEVELDLDTT